MVPGGESLGEEGEDAVLGDGEGGAEDPAVIGGEHGQEEEEGEGSEESRGQEFLHGDGEGELVEEGPALFEEIVGLSLGVDAGQPAFLLGGRDTSLLLCVLQALLGILASFLL